MKIPALIFYLANYDMIETKQNTRQKIIYLSLIALLPLLVTCQSPTNTATEQWLPLYLQLQLNAGQVQMRAPGDSEWTTIDRETTINVEETIQIIADTAEGAEFRTGDGSTLKLMPHTNIEMQNPNIFPRLQITVQEGQIVLVTQKPSYEIIVPACTMTLLSLPAHVNAQVDDGATRLTIEEGAVVCTLETGTLTLPKCQEMYAKPGGEPKVIEFCDADATATTAAMTPSPTFDFQGPDTTPTPTATPSPSWTPPSPVPTRQTESPTPTTTPPPTPPPAPPPPKDTPRPTQPPPTQPPTNTPQPTQPPPTDTPAPPTNTPRPTPTKPPRPTDIPPSPTDTPAPPTDTPAPPTDTPVPPADTPVPPTDTPTPTK